MAGNVKQIISDCLDSANILFFTVVMMLFPYSAYKRHKATWNDHKKAFAIQATGLAAALLVDITINVFAWVSTIYKDQTLLYYALNTAQITSMYIFILSKQPQDLFKLFNKRPDAQFSIYQYPNHDEVERKITLRRNTAYLER